MMEWDKDGKRMVMTYDMDGSKWVFRGFVEKDGEHYMILEPHEETLATDPNWDSRYEVHLPEGDYIELKQAVDTLHGEK
jgi:hypothetical protein